MSYWRNGKEFKEIKRAKSIGEIPSESIEVYSFPDEPVIHRCSLLLRYATSALRDELKNHEALYNGFLASIESAINETSKSATSKELATAILERIIG